MRLVNRLIGWWKLKRDAVPAPLTYIHEGEFFEKADRKSCGTSEDQPTIPHAGIGPAKRSARVDEFTVGDRAFAKISVVDDDSCFVETNAFDGPHSSPFTTTRCSEIETRPRALSLTHLPTFTFSAGSG